MAHVLSAPKAVGGISLKIKRGRLVTEETRQWFLTADSDSPDEREFLQIPGYPIPYQLATTFGICTSSNCDRVPGNRRLWSVTATFTSDIEEQSGFTPGDLTTSPETWVPVREVSLEPYDIVRTKDLDGLAFTNGAGVPFDTAPPITDDLVKWDFFQFEPITGTNAVTDLGLAARNMTINETGFIGCAPDTLLLRVRKSTVGFYYGARRRLTEYSLTYKPSTWHERLPNIGNSFRANGVLYPYRYYVEDADGNLDKQASSAIHTGPLGTRDLPTAAPFLPNTLNPAEGQSITTFGFGDDAPAGGVIKKNGQIYALPATPGTLYYIERRVYTRLAFGTFLRVT